MDDARDERLVPTDQEVEDVIREFGGDPRAAIRALLHDLAVLAGDYETRVSHGFVRGEVPHFTLPRRA